MSNKCNHIIGTSENGYIGLSLVDEKGIAWRNMDSLKDYEDYLEDHFKYCPNCGEKLYEQEA